MYYWTMSKTPIPFPGFQQILLFIALLIGSGVFSTLLTKVPEIHGNRAQISSVAQMVLAVGYGIALLLVTLKWRLLRKTEPVTLALWLILVAWVLTSILGGQLNGSTLARFAGFAGNTFLGVALFLITPKPRDMLRQVCLVSAVILAINLWFIPTSQYTDWTSRLISGTFVQINVLGMTCAIAVIAAASILFNERSQPIRIICILTLLTATWLLSLTRSMTSMLMLLIMGLSMVSILLFRHHRPRPIWILGILSFSIVCVFTFRKQLFSLIGKDGTLTGRTDIWGEYVAHILNQPIMGFGYGSLPANATALMKMEAHNGFIQLAYYTGGVGVLLFLVVLIRALIQATQKALIPTSRVYDSFVLSYLIGFTAINFSEVYTLSRSLLVWPLFVYITLYLSQRNMRATPQTS
jgi:O-antigen ligase